MKSFTASSVQRSPANLFNAVQANGKAEINHQSRPNMTVIITEEYEAMLEKIKQLGEAIVKLESKGDSKNQLGA